MVPNMIIRHETVNRLAAEIRAPANSALFCEVITLNRRGTPMEFFKIRFGNDLDELTSKLERTLEDMLG